MNTGNIDINDIRQRINKFENFLSLDPNNTDLLIQLGDLHHHISEFDKASDYYSKTLQLEDSDIARGRLASLNISQHRFEQAESLLTELLQNASADPALLFNLALAQYQQRKWEDAEQHFNAAMAGGADKAACLEYLTRTLHHLHKFDEAKQVCQDWITASESSKARGYLALLEMDSGQSDKARELARQVLATDPDNTDATIVLSISDIEEQDIDIAVERFEKILAREPAHPRALFGLGLSRLHQQQHGKAIALMQQASRLMPQDTGILIAIGWAKTAQQDLAGAEQIFRQVIEIDRNFSEGYGGLAYVLALQTKIEEARTAMQRAQWLDPGSFGAAASQSVLLGLEQGTDQAVDFLAKALELPPGPGQRPIIEHIQTYIRKHGPKQADAAPDNRS